MYFIAWEDYDYYDRFHVPTVNLMLLAAQLEEDGHGSAVEIFERIMDMAAGETIHIGPVNIEAFDGDFPGWNDENCPGWSDDE